MSLRARPPVILAFTLGAFALGLLMVYLFGGRDIFSRREPFLVYFDDTVNGLEHGSLVMFKGVPIGFVDAIRLNYRDSTKDRRIPVLIQLNADGLQRRLGMKENLSDPVVFADMMRRGLCAQLEHTSYVTGGMFVELDFSPQAPTIVIKPGPDGLAVIPTIPSKSVSNLNHMQEMATWLPTFDFQAEVGKAGDYLDTLTTKVAVIPYAEYSKRVTNFVRPLANLNVRSFQRNLNNAIDRFDAYRATLATADQQFAAASQDFVARNAATRENLAQIDAGLATLRDNLNPDAPWLAHLTHNVAQFSKDLDNLAGKTNALEQQPDLLNKLSK